MAASANSPPMKKGIGGRSRRRLPPSFFLKRLSMAEDPLTTDFRHWKNPPFSNGGRSGLGDRSRALGILHMESASLFVFERIVVLFRMEQPGREPCVDDFAA